MRRKSSWPAGTQSIRARDEMVEKFKDMVLRARGAPGCLDMVIAADPVDSNRINLFEFWRSEKT